MILLPPGRIFGWFPDERHYFKVSFAVNDEERRPGIKGPFL